MTLRQLIEQLGKVYLAQGDISVRLRINGTEWAFVEHDPAKHFIEANAELNQLDVFDNRVVLTNLKP